MFAIYAHVSSLAGGFWADLAKAQQVQVIRII